MVKNFKALLDNTQDATHPLAIFSSAREFVTHKSRSTTFLSDEQLQVMELCFYHGIKDQVKCLEGQWICRMCRCTGSKSSRRGYRRNNRVWVMQRPGRRYVALNGRLPWQLHWLFKIKLLNKDGAFAEYYSALVLTTIAENLGNLDPVLKFVQVRNALAAVALKVVIMETSSAART